jgi:hypothetical protein
MHLFDDFHQQDKMTGCRIVYWNILIRTVLIRSQLIEEVEYQVLLDLCPPRGYSHVWAADVLF